MEGGKKCLCLTEVVQLEPEVVYLQDDIVRAFLRPDGHACHQGATETIDQAS